MAFMLSRYRRGTIALAALTTGLIAGGGIACTVWALAGRGANAPLGSRPQVVAVQTSPVAALTTASDVRPLSGVFSNYSNSAITISRISAKISVIGQTVQGLAYRRCTAADFVVRNPVVAEGHFLTVPAEADGVEGWGGGTIQLKESADSLNSCAGATVTLSYRVT